MPYITVGKENSGNIDLYYEDHGTGKPVVLIHGWPLSGASWEKQLPVLLKAGYRVITYDRRGLGKSSQPATGYNYDTLAEELNQILTKLDLNEVTLAGFSMGGGEVARYIGKQGTGRLARVAFLSSICPFLLKTPNNPAGVDGSVFEDIKKNIAKDRLGFLARFFVDFYNFDALGGKLISDQFVQLSWNIAAGASPIATIECVSAWLEDFREDLKKCDVPTLVIHGDADRTLPIAVTGKRTAELIPGSRYTVIEDAPHGCTWTHASKINEELLDFLAKPGKGAAK